MCLDTYSFMCDRHQSVLHRFLSYLKNTNIRIKDSVRGDVEIRQIPDWVERQMNANAARQYMEAQEAEDEAFAQAIHTQEAIDAQWNDLVDDAILEEEEAVEQDEIMREHEEMLMDTFDEGIPHEDLSYGSGGAQNVNLVPSPPTVIRLVVNKGPSPPATRGRVRCGNACLYSQDTTVSVVQSGPMPSRPVTRGHVRHGHAQLLSDTKSAGLKKRCAGK